MKRLALLIASWIWLGSLCLGGTAPEVNVDLSGYRPDCGVEVKHDGGRLVVRWPMAEDEFGRLALNLVPGEPLIESLDIDVGAKGSEPHTLLSKLDPATFLTVGTREAPQGRPPEMSVFNVFFDSPAKRDHETYLAKLDLKQARVTSNGHRATVALNDVSAGPFRGRLEFTVYPGARLIHVEAVVSTEEDRRAILYDAGLLEAPGSVRPRFVWLDTEMKPQSGGVDSQVSDRTLAVRYRTLIANCDGGSVACFPPPHQFFFPRDLTDNLGYLWCGTGHRKLTDRFGFGIRQSEQGGGSFVPWCNAPPGTEQRLGVFYLLSRGGPAETLQEVLAYTHGDRFPALPGYRTLTSHWHMAVAVAALKEHEQGRAETIPDFVQMFRSMGVNMVHLAEFHGDGHAQDPGPLRLSEMESMFSECRRLSDADLLFIPGEEANVYLGIQQPGKNPGHWLYLFPRPVYWIMKRAAGEPFVTEHPKYGTVYRVGSIADMVALIEREHGLAWTAHPRIKASSWTPDIFRNEDFYKAGFWLGAAFKAMPADLARPRLGERCLDLLSDMDNWGQKKYMLGEVDVFKLDHTHELYGNMNINYVKLDHVPRFEEGWQPVLSALRDGRFFVTTGEVLVPEFTIGGKSSGETLATADSRPEVRATLEWTFPLRFAELVSGDGRNVYRERIDLADTGPFGKRALTLKPDLSGRTWARLEAWDVATNGAFTQPVWLAPRQASDAN